MNSAADKGRVAEPRRGEKSGLQILLVDDSAINQTIGLRLLNNSGLNADLASNGQEAIAAHQKKSYDLILMDVQMPEMDGLEATRRIRAIGNRNSNSGPVVIALTGAAQSNDREKCLAAGMNDYIAKPFDPDAFAASIKNWAIKIQTGSPLNPPLPGAATNARASAIIDLKKIRQYTDGSKQALQELIDLYLENTAKYLSAIESALAQNDIDLLRRVAHKAAGSSATCGMEFLAEAFREIEQNAETQNADNAPSLLQSANNEFTRVRTALDSELR
jgi:CheY-like chemotaxis protein